MSNYNNDPVIDIDDNNRIKKKTEIHKELSNYDKIIIECYPGTDVSHFKEYLSKYYPKYKSIFIDDYSRDNVQELIKETITDDRVFGFMSNHTIDEFYLQSEIEKIQDHVNKTDKVIVFGFGASQIKGEALVMADLARWEIQLRLRNGMSNWKCENSNEDPIRKFKRGYFFEWRVADRIKTQKFEEFDYFLDMNNTSDIKLISGDLVRTGLKKACNMPFRLVPFFDMGVWGGQWMKDKCNLDTSKENYAWSFDGVPEENSIKLQYGNDFIELPAMDLVKYQPKQLLGDSVYGRFGSEFPIRFDFLDTIGGQNLSLQVHPLVDYIQEKFGMHYTQDESYYILDVDKAACPKVYIGTKTGIDESKFKNALISAQETGKPLNVENYINAIPVKKHDHVSIPAGTVHCSGSGTMVLEISATPYIFTFKLYDWDRMGMDGIPRPIHLEHGFKNIQFDRDTEFVHKNLFNNFTKISDVEEKTGLFKSEFIETRRYFTSEPSVHKTNGKFQMLNLIDGESIIIRSTNNEFEDYLVNYAETFIIPAGVKEYLVVPSGHIGLIKAYVR